MQTFDTSYGYDKLSLKLGLKDIIVTMCPLSHTKKNFHFEFVNCSDGKCKGISMRLEKGLRIPYILNDESLYYLNIYIQSDVDSSYYVSYIQPKSIKLQCLNGRLRFVDSPVLLSNRKIINELRDDGASLEQYKRSSGYFDYSDLRLRNLAVSITKNCVTMRQKAAAIHDWITSHIYYDCDALKNGTYWKRDNSPTAILKDKRCVCVGFTYLMVSLLRSVGIPSIVQNCFALNISNDGDWEFGDNMISEANHVMTIAYFENRWRVIDVTWDTFNRYENQEFNNKMSSIRSRLYFDATIEFISNTHRFC